MKAWMALIDSMVDDNVDDQLQELQIPCHRCCSFMEPLMYDTHDLIMLTQTSIQWIFTWVTRATLFIFTDGGRLDSQQM